MSRMYPPLVFWATVCKTVRPMLSDRCLSCPVCDVGVLWPNGWTDPDETWQAGRSLPWPHCDRLRSRSPSLKEAQAPIFGPYLLWTNGSMDQDATWLEGRPRPKRHCIRWGPRFPSQKGGRDPNLRPMSIVAKRLDGIRCHLIWS